ncbi:MAG: DNA-binding response regulator [Oscillatoriales cyanobacterium]|nr:MAG: DNA-binding response regulator [Oscillatoriales cyanobacterium]
MAPVKILVVDDDPAIRNLIHRFLSQQGYQVESAADGQTGLELFDQLNPDLVVLDVNLPDTTGYKLCQEMQKRTGVFVLMLTSRTDEADKMKGFAEGADDYITKPFSLVEIGARVAAILKRKRLVTPTQQQSLTFGQLLIDPVRRELLQEVWDYEYVGADRVVDVHIGQIRRKIEPDTNQISMIQTVRGVGYKFEPKT